jgi:hypothetical protein
MTLDGVLPFQHQDRLGIDHAWIELAGQNFPPPFGRTLLLT